MIVIYDTSYFFIIFGFRLFYLSRLWYYFMKNKLYIVCFKSKKKRKEKRR
jgi:hypothetical protein